MAVKNLGRVVGLSAYEVWLEQGNTGTEEEYFASLKGEKGDQGIKGTNGVYVGAEEPTDEDVDVWVDTDENPLPDYATKDDVAEAIAAIPTPEPAADSPIIVLEAKEGENVIYYQNDVRNNNLDNMGIVAYKVYYLKHPLAICRNDTTILFEAGNVIMAAEYIGSGDVNVDDILYGFEYDYRLSMIYMDFEIPGKATRYDKISTKNFESTGKQYFYTKAQVDAAIQNALNG